MLPGMALCGDLAAHYWFNGGVTPDDVQIVLMDRNIHSRVVTEADTTYRKARLGWWAHCRLERSVAKADFSNRGYSPPDTGVFCEGGVVFTVILHGQKTVLRETCRLEKPEADVALNRDRDQIKKNLQDKLERDKSPSGPEEFEKALAEFRKRAGEG
jgi:hypothetical protein